MEKGLSTQRIAELQHQYGKNKIDTKISQGYIDILVSQFITVINGILFFAAIFSLLIHNTLDAFFIIAIIILNAFFGFMQEYKAQKSINKLKNYTAPFARVIREGGEKKVLAEELVPEDIVLLAEGDRVPADGTLLEEAHIEIDESILTGESLPMLKTHKDLVSLGTLVTRGNGKFKVTQIGLSTNFGQIADTLSSLHEEKAPLQKNLDQLGKMLSLGAILIGLLIIPIGLLYKENLVPLILVGISIGIAAIPEGLPVIVTMAFAHGAHKIIKKGAIVKRMSAIETLGAVQVILVDKTGTITKNTMKVKKYWQNDHDSLPDLIQACTLGNTASLIKKGAEGEYEILGDPTDGALLMWTHEQNAHPDIAQNDNAHLIDEYMFDTESKTITTVLKKGGSKYVFVRGAPEAIIAKSRLTKDEKEQIIKHFENMAKEGLRIIGFAKKDERHVDESLRTHLENNLTFLGLIGMYDPPREGIKIALQKSRSAGIKAIMVTGDNEITALTLGREIGLIEKNEDLVTGAALSKMTDSELESIILHTSIFARSKPKDKLRLVSVIKKMGYVVGVTGDGVNDALALKSSDVGVSMGKGGTDVAQEASDMVLTDNNFATLIDAIVEGRIIYKNITNAIIYLLSGNLAEISLVFMANLLHLPFPLLPTQILWINLVTDSLPALALAMGSHDPSLISKNPRNPRDPLLTSKRLLTICLIGFSLSTFLLLVFFESLKVYSHIKASTIVFNLLIFLHLFIVIGLGRHSLRRKNTFMILTIIIIFLLQIIITTVPFFQQIFHLEI